MLSTRSVPLQNSAPWETYIAQLKKAFGSAEEEARNKHLFDHHSVPVLHAVVGLPEDYQPSAGQRVLQVRLQMHLLL